MTNQPDDSDKEKDLIENLPSLVKGPCNDCGSITWNRSNLDPSGGFYQCNDCTEWDEKTQTRIRKNLQ